MIKELHLFAGIGGGIYGGELLGHKCCAGVEILPYAQRVLKQRQEDGWLPKFPIYDDLCELSGDAFKGQFDVLCGGFPCQAFSSAAHGKNIASKNLWKEMFRFVKESDAPIVFGENVVMRAIERARKDLEGVGYRVARIRLSNQDLGADHLRYRYWLMAVKDETAFSKLAEQIRKLPKLTGRCWEKSPQTVAAKIPLEEIDRTDQLLGVGNAQSPLVAASAFRILVNRLSEKVDKRRAGKKPKVKDEVVSSEEISSVFDKRKTWMRKTYGDDFGRVHTPTTVANYCCKSMSKHVGCRNYVKVFCDDRGMPENERHPMPTDAEYLMGFPLGASCPHPLVKDNFTTWKGAN